MYTYFQKMMHWVMAVVIILLTLMGFFLDTISDAFKGTAYMMHKSFGVVVLCLMIIRLISRWVHPPKVQYHAINALHHFISQMSVWVLYSIVFLMSISGFIMSLAGGYGISLFNLFDMPYPFDKNIELAGWMHTVHTTFSFVIAGVILLHILAALWHHYFLKDDTLKRMLP